MAQAEVEANDGRPVVRDEVDTLDSKGIEQTHNVGYELVAVVPSARRVGPTGASKVGADNPVALCEPRKHLAPLPPVLREAVQEQSRIADACLGDVHAKAGKFDEAVRHAVERWDLRHDSTLLRT
jgi:hypothetical protein